MVPKFKANGEACLVNVFYGRCLKCCCGACLTVAYAFPLSSAALNLGQA